MYTVWPKRDGYFSMGINGLYANRAVNTELMKDCVFIDFQKHNIRFFLSSAWVWSFPGKNIIAITDKNLLPLANYYSRRFANVFPILNKEVTATDLVEKTKIKHTYEDVLTEREYKTLVYFSRGVSANEQAMIMDLSMKTIYAFRKKAAIKLGYNKIIELFYHT